MRSRTSRSGKDCAESITVRFTPEPVYRVSRLCIRAALGVRERLWGGDWARTLGRAFRYSFKRGSRKRGAVLCFSALGYLLGQSPSVRLLPSLAKSVEELRLDFLDGCTSSRKENRRLKKGSFDALPVAKLKETLYHITPEENVKSILKTGLVTENCRVFLTDDVDCKRLSDLHTIYEYLPHEFVVERVEPEFISYV